MAENKSEYDECVEELAREDAGIVEHVEDKKPFKWHWFWIIFGIFAGFIHYGLFMLFVILAGICAITYGK